LRHGDVFKEYVMPQMMAGNKADWDNLSDEEEEEVRQSPTASSIHSCKRPGSVRPE
jgi:hypothetical protein